MVLVKQWILRLSGICHLSSLVRTTILVWWYLILFIQPWILQGSHFCNLVRSTTLLSYPFLTIDLTSLIFTMGFPWTETMVSILRPSPGCQSPLPPCANITDTNIYSKSHKLCARFVLCCMLLWLGTGIFYVYSPTSVTSLMVGLPHCS